MNDVATDLSAELQDELEANERPFVDPRTIPTRYSLLKQMAKSPAHYLEACQREQDDETLAARLGAAAPTGTKRSDALRIGTGAHQMLLGDLDKVARYSLRRAGKAWTEYQAECSERGVVEILSDKEWTMASSICEAVRRNRTALRLLLDGTIIERRIDWEWCGKAVRSTPDARTMGYVVDLKTAQTAQPDQFVRAAVRLYYHAQAWLYSEAVESATSVAPGELFVIAVEKTAPFPVSVLRFTDRALELGARQCRLWIERLLTCEATNSWPEYLTDVGEFDVMDYDLGLEFEGRKVEL